MIDRVYGLQGSVAKMPGFDELEIPVGYEGVVPETANAILKALQSILVATRAMKPIQRVAIKGLGRLITGSDSTYIFELNGKNVPALSLMIQNNTGGVLNVGMDLPAGPATWQIVAGGSLSVKDVAINAIHLYVAAGTPSVAGPDDSPTSGTAGIVIQAWGNPEFSVAYGA